MRASLSNSPPQRSSSTAAPSCFPGLAASCSTRRTVSAICSVWARADTHCVYKEFTSIPDGRRLLSATGLSPMFHLDWHFFPVFDSPDLGTDYIGVYDPALVTISVVIAILAAFVALSISGRIVAAQ